MIKDETLNDDDSLDEDFEASLPKRRIKQGGDSFVEVSFKSNLFINMKLVCLL